MNVILEESECAVEIVSDGVVRRLKAPEDYDVFRFLRLRDPSDGKAIPGVLCLYFKDGYLVAKCVVGDSKELDPAVVFSKEVASGKQDPRRDTELMKRVVWGKPVEPEIDYHFFGTAEERAKSRKSAPVQPRSSKPVKIRCGIVVKQEARSAPDKSYNVLALYENAGSTTLEEPVYLLGFPAGPQLSISARFRKVEGDIGDGAYAGLYGTQKRSIPSEKEGTRNYVAPFRLAPGEKIYMWFSMPRIDECKWIRAEMFAMFSSPGTGQVRCLDAKSATVTIAAKVERLP